VSVTLLYPAALLAIVAILVPMFLHLRRRSEQITVDFAALRWLTAHMKPRRRPRIDEHWLLLMRCLLIALIALLLAQPKLRADSDWREWQLVSTALNIRGIAELNGDTGANAYWLAPGFPSIREPRPSVAPNTSSLLREFDASLGQHDKLRVWVPARVDGLDGERVRLLRTLEWRIAPAQADLPGGMATPAPPLAQRMDLRIDANSQSSQRYWLAALAAWNSATVPTANPPVGARTPRFELIADEIADDDAPASAGDWLLWLRAGELPAPIAEWIAAGGTALVARTTRIPNSAVDIALWRDAAGDPLVRAQPMGRGRLLQWQRELIPAALPELLDARFPSQLRALFEPAQAVPMLADAASVKPLIGAFGTAKRSRGIDDWLLALIFVVLAIERWLATNSRRMQSADA